jgi:hypothetical protein
VHVVTARLSNINYVNFSSTQTSQGLVVQFGFINYVRSGLTMREGDVMTTSAGNVSMFSSCLLNDFIVLLF